MAKDPKNKKNFFKNFKAELKKVIWPTPKQIINNTVAVVTIVLITAVIVFVLDLTFDLFNNAGINRLKSKIQEKENTSMVDNQTDDDTIVEPESDETGADTETNEIAE